MRISLLLFCLFSFLFANSQWKSYLISVKGDTINCIDKADLKQGPWVLHVDELRGEPGYEEEGYFQDNKREGTWRKYNLQGDLLAVENYKWGEKDGKQQYFTPLGDLLREESWRATNPENPYDTISVPDLYDSHKFETKIVKLEVATVAHGTWTYYDPQTGFIIKTEKYFFGQLDKGSVTTAASSTKKETAAKPKEVADWEKKNSGKKNVKVRDGSTGGPQ
ncbi:MAG: hypothetical protein C5B52_07435 [Bacteroidetes bacterium]|nr:MAG: hypothetical protein C5B52_07435 [Bacteroidota bacterium]